MLRFLFCIVILRFVSAGERYSVYYGTDDCKGSPILVEPSTSRNILGECKYGMIVIDDSDLDTYVYKKLNNTKHYYQSVSQYSNINIAVCDEPIQVKYYSKGSYYWCKHGVKFTSYYCGEIMKTHACGKLCRDKWWLTDQELTKWVKRTGFCNDDGYCSDDSLSVYQDSKPQMDKPGQFIIEYCDDSAVIIGMMDTCIRSYLTAIWFYSNGTHLIVDLCQVKSGGLEAPIPIKDKCDEGDVRIAKLSKSEASENNNLVYYVVGGVVLALITAGGLGSFVVYKTKTMGRYTQL